LQHNRGKADIGQPPTGLDLWVRALDLGFAGAGLQPPRQRREQERRQIDRKLRQREFVIIVSWDYR
jgi:hypothetical protein